MARISDDISNDFVRGDGVDVVSYRKMLSIADRIDSEMMELPKDADVVPIHVGDTVWNDAGYKLRVVSITSYGDTYRVHTVCQGRDFYVGPEDLTRNRTDSFEHIADELDEMVDAARHADDTCERLADLAERIRKLAKEGE